MKARTLPPYEVLMPLAPWEQPQVLAAALASVACQRPAPERLILSVDGALPETLASEVRQLELPMVVVVGPGGEGVGRVLARGLAVCRCELILRADADDISCPHRAQRQLAWMTAHPEVVAGSAWIGEFFEEPSQLAGYRRVPVNAGVGSWASWRNPLNHPAVVFCRSAVLSVGGYRHQPGFEDYDLWLRLLRRYGPSALNNLPEVLVLARVGPAHLARRRGIHYAAYELRFLWRSAQEGQLGWSQALLLGCMRLPWRLMPARALAMLMFVMRR